MFLSSFHIYIIFFYFFSLWYNSSRDIAHSVCSRILSFNSQGELWALRALACHAEKPWSNCYIFIYLCIYIYIYTTDSRLVCAAPFLDAKNARAYREKVPCLQNSLNSYIAIAAARAPPGQFFNCYIPPWENKWIIGDFEEGRDKRENINIYMYICITKKRGLVRALRERGEKKKRWRALLFHGPIVFWLSIKLL